MGLDAAAACPISRSPTHRSVGVTRRPFAVYRYSIAGLTVSSDVELPGVHAAPPHEGAPDVTIREGAAPDRLDDATASGPTWAMAPSRFLLRVPGIARFLLTD